MEFSSLIKSYQPISLKDKVTAYETWALKFFHQKDIVSDPILDMTLQMDITKAKENFEKNYKEKKTSFTCFLIFKLLQAIDQSPCFKYRRLEDGHWYQLDNLPLFFPVATGNKARFRDVTLMNAASLSWSDFSRTYQKKIQEALTTNQEYEQMNQETWALSHFIGNLPNLQFTSFNIHKPTHPIGRPFFYFGKRYELQEALYIPLSISFDHSNIDPVILSIFIEKFQKNLEA